MAHMAYMLGDDYIWPDMYSTCQEYFSAQR